MPLEFSRVTLPPLWTTAEAKQLQLRIRDALHDAEVAEKLATAQEAVVAYLGPAADPAWDATTAPKAVKHAILLVTAHYYEHRGDDMNVAGAGATDEALWQAVARLLALYRDPTLA